ncbi:uncharacterized protein ARMOST_14986 [Armillaria ostoyae]|uniref:Uncharacterized protein n=1 Tax=Armillaria ostoyae TaxID=47428 RepID=A0A284RS46_ARMOS|nr:uncharacterized protein ARMOST_14986 [Armillaria ostoyae]
MRVFAIICRSGGYSGSVPIHCDVPTLLQRLFLFVDVGLSLQRYPVYPRAPVASCIVSCRLADSVYSTRAVGGVNYLSVMPAMISIRELWWTIIRAAGGVNDLLWNARQRSRYPNYL